MHTAETEASEQLPHRHMFLLPCRDGVPREVEIAGGGNLFAHIAEALRAKRRADVWPAGLVRRNAAVPLSDAVRRADATPRDLDAELDVRCLCHVMPTPMCLPQPSAWSRPHPKSLNTPEERHGCSCRCRQGDSCAVALAIGSIAAQCPATATLSFKWPRHPATCSQPIR